MLSKIMEQTFEKVIFRLKDNMVQLQDVRFRGVDNAEIQPIQKLWTKILDWQPIATDEHIRPYVLFEDLSKVAYVDSVNFNFKDKVVIFELGEAHDVDIPEVQ